MINSIKKRWINKVSSLPIHKIVRIRQLIPIIFNTLVIVELVIVFLFQRFNLVSQIPLFVSIILGGPFLVSFFTALYFSSAGVPIFDRSLSNVFFETVDLEKNKNYYNLIASKSSKLSVKLSADIVNIYTDFLEGEFTECLSKISKLFPLDTLHPEVQLICLHYQCLADFFSSQEIDYSIIRQSIVDLQVRDEDNKLAILNELDALNDILRYHQSNNYFDENKTYRHKLQYLQVLYYQSLNAKLLGDDSKVYSVYQKLSKKILTYFLLGKLGPI